MLIFDKRFKEAREYLGMNRSDFAKYLKIAPSTVSRYENGSMDVAIGAIEKIASKLNMNMAWLLGLSDNMYDVEVPYKKIPVLGKIKTLPIFDFENFEDFEIFKNSNKVDFCIRIKDNSLERAGVKPGSTVFFKKQDTAENEDIVAVMIDNNILIRRYFKYGKQIVLKAEGIQLNDYLLEDANILGKAILHISGVE